MKIDMGIKWKENDIDTKFFIGTEVEMPLIQVRCLLLDIRIFILVKKF